VSVKLLCRGLPLGRGGGGGTSPTTVAHVVIGPTPRQMRIGPRCRTVCRSVVSLGVVQVRRTLSPLRVARRSATGFGSSREGGKGGPGEPQPQAISNSVINPSSQIFCDASIPRRYSAYHVAKQIGRHSWRPNL